jgi:hypothetical protein
VPLLTIDLDNCNSVPKIVISWSVCGLQLSTKFVFITTFKDRKYYTLIFCYTDCAVLRLKDYIYCSQNLLIFLNFGVH